MTVTTLLKERTLPLMGERSTMAAEYQEFCPALVNLLLADVFEVNEDIRALKGKEPLGMAGLVLDMEDEIPVEDELIAAMSYGLGARLTLDEGDMNKTGFLEHGYVERVNALKRAAYVNVAEGQHEGI